MNRSERLENLSAYIDGELTENEQRLLAAWVENHPEDLDDYEELAEVVSCVRGLPLVEPPAGLMDQILRAVAEAEPVGVDREQAAAWLDDYFDGELSEPRRAVVEHYLAVDAEFAELAELHQAMLNAVRDVDEVEPPADLRARIQDSVHGRRLRPAVITRRKLTAPARRTLAVAAGLILVVGAVAIGLRGSGRGPVEVAKEPAQPAEVVPAPNLPRVPQPVTDPATVAAGQSGPSDTAVSGVPELPMDDANQPVVSDGMDTRPATTRRAPTPVTPADSRNVADGSRREAKSRVDSPRSQEKGTKPAATGRKGGEADKKKAGKQTPKQKPAPLGVESSGGMLAEESGKRSSTSQAPEFVGSRGNTSVLGGDLDGKMGVGSDGGEGGGTRGRLDPTRRTEAPPF